MRKDSIFSRLTEVQQADLFDWLSTDSFEAVKKRIAQPPPDGFGIRAHINSLFRFYQQRLAQNRSLDLAAALSVPDEPGKIEQPANSAEPPAKSFIRSSLDAHAHSTWSLANSPQNLGAFRATAKVLFQHEDIALKRDYIALAREQLALARERFALQRSQFEFDAARAALAVLPDLMAIHQNSGLDDEAKINRVRQRLFGSSSSDSNLSNE